MQDFELCGFIYLFIFLTKDASNLMEGLLMFPTDYTLLEKLLLSDKGMQEFNQFLI